MSEDSVGARSNTRSGDYHPVEDIIVCFASDNGHTDPRSVSGQGNVASVPIAHETSGCPADFRWSNVDGKF